MKLKLLVGAVFLMPSLFAQEKSIIEENRTSYLLDDKSIIEEDYLRIKIFSEEGYKNSIYLNYTDKYRDIKSIRVNVYDANNKRVKTLSKGDAIEVGFNPSYEINDAKRIYIDPKYKNYPFVIEMTSKVKLNGFISLPTWVPRNQFDVAVKHAELVFEYPESMKVHFKEEFITPTQTELTEGILRKKYVVNDLPAVPAKVRYQDFFIEQPKVYISPQKFWLDDKVGSNESWKDFGNWFYSLNNESFSLTQETKSFIDDRKSKATQRELVRDIYMFMQDKTRYVSIQLGIGGFKSLPIESVEKFGYGDCKALSTYMKAMLYYAGITSNYILTRAGRDVPDVLKDFPSNQFNHVYIGVPMKSDTIFLECTSQESPYNYTGTFTDDRNVLWVEKDDSKIIRSRIYDHKMNRQENKAQISIDSLGQASISLDVKNHGIFFDEVMLFQRAQSDYVAAFNQRKFTYPDFTIKDFKFKHPDRANAEFESNYLIQVNGMGKRVGAKMVLPYTFTIPASKYVIKDEMMKYCAITRGIHVSDNVSVTLPKNYWAYQLPEPEVIDSKFGKYSLKMEFSGDKLIIKRDITLYKGDYKKAEYEGFQDFFGRIEKLENKKLVLNSKT